MWRVFSHAQRPDELPWTSAVFVRDPLERFLSGWFSKCTPGHDLDREVCTALFGDKVVGREKKNSHVVRPKIGARLV